MPWIFLFLLTLNIGYFGWQLTKDIAGPVTAAAQPLNVEGKRLDLLAERPDVVAAAEAKKQADEAAAEGRLQVNEMASQCYSVGPFAKRGEADVFASGAVAKSLISRVDEVRANVADYWVFLPAFVNRAKAEERLRELKRDGIDSFIVNDPAYANAISLGHFSQEAKAQEARDKFRARGVLAEMRALTKNSNQYWVYVAPAATGGDAKAITDTLMAKVDGIRRQPAACDG